MIRKALNLWVELIFENALFFIGVSTVIVFALMHG
jgi:hypothetical protein